MKCFRIGSTKSFMFWRCCLGNVQKCSTTFSLGQMPCIFSVYMYNGITSMPCSMFFLFRSWWKGVKELEGMSKCNGQCTLYSVQWAMRNAQWVFQALIVIPLYKLGGHNRIQATGTHVETIRDLPMLCSPQTEGRECRDWRNKQWETLVHQRGHNRNYPLLELRTLTTGSDTLITAAEWLRPQKATRLGDDVEDCDKFIK